MRAQLALGDIFEDQAFYVDKASGNPRAKFLLALAFTASDDLVFRLLTSKPRQQDPPCFHGDPYPAFFLGVPGAPLNRDTWIDLRPQGDYEGDSLCKNIADGQVRQVLALPRELFLVSLVCIGGAPDTTQLQAQLVADTRAALNGR